MMLRLLLRQIASLVSIEATGAGDPGPGPSSNIEDRGLGMRLPEAPSFDWRKLLKQSQGSCSSLSELFKYVH